MAAGGSECGQPSDRGRLKRERERERETYCWTDADQIPAGSSAARRRKQHLRMSSLRQYTSTLDNPGWSLFTDLLERESNSSKLQCISSCRCFREIHVGPVYAQLNNLRYSYTPFNVQRSTIVPPFPFCVCAYFYFCTMPLYILHHNSFSKFIHFLRPTMPLICLIFMQPVNDHRIGRLISNCTICYMTLCRWKNFLSYLNCLCFTYIELCRKETASELTDGLLWDSSKLCTMKFIV